MDSDVDRQGGSIGLSGSFTLYVDEEEHRADAGVIGEGEKKEFNPEISIEQSCSYFNPDNPVALVKVIVNNSKSEVGARVQVPLGELEEGVTAPVEVFTVAPGASGNTEITREYGEVFEVRVFAAENQGLYETVVEPVTIDCPRFDVEVELGEIDCKTKPPTVTVIFKNNSDVSVSFDYEIFETLVGGGRNTPPIKGSGSGPFLEPGEQEAQQITVDKNWTWMLNRTDED